MKTHVLKTLPEPFQATLDGLKKFELREDDRGFEVGDRIVLQEYDGNRNTFTGRHKDVVVTYKLAAPAYGLPHNLCILGVREEQATAIKNPFLKLTELAVRDREAAVADAEELRDALDEATKDLRDMTGIRDNCATHYHAARKALEEVVELLGEETSAGPDAIAVTGDPAHALAVARGALGRLAP
jgi:hypothetical protein